MTTPVLRHIRLAAIAAALFVSFTTTSFAQSSSPPPVPGATGTITPDGKGDGATTAIGAGAGKVVEGAKKVLRPGGKEEKQETDPLKTLELGTKVVIREGDASVRAAEPVTSSRFEDKEGTVIELDRRTRVIVLRLADKTTVRLRLDEPRSGDKSSDKSQDARASQASGDKVTLSYTDTNGDRTTTVFRKVE